MGESSGVIVFINSHDYVSQASGMEVVGCMASLMPEEGKEVVVYTQSLRLQHTLEMAYATKHKVLLDYSETVEPAEQRGPVTKATAAEPVGGLEGPFKLQAMWTLE